MAACCGVLLLCDSRRLVWAVRVLAVLFFLPLHFPCNGRGAPQPRVMGPFPLLPLPRSPLPPRSPSPALPCHSDTLTWCSQYGCFFPYQAEHTSWSFFGLAFLLVCSFLALGFLVTVVLFFALPCLAKLIFYFVIFSCALYFFFSTPDAESNPSLDIYNKINWFPYTRLPGKPF